MTLEEKNQNDILNEFNDPNDMEFIFGDKPINRFKTKPELEDKISLLAKLKNDLQNYKTCELDN